ncbi:MAG TPA: rhomboid family intramembrane serine protease [Phycisphaerae bacterium]|nr:rhomboid family intramembrane serine protease [Phycisphaerae bacterium]
MSWQDRDYAREPTPQAGGRAQRVTWGHAPTGRSIVTTLIVINVALHLLWGFFPAAQPLYKLGMMQTEAVLHGQVWRLVTSQYLHDTRGLDHILFNMIGLYFLGRALERVWSPKKFLAIYTLAGIAGNFLFMALCLTGWFGWFSMQQYMVGASGCILGLLGACAVLFPHAEVYVYFLFPLKIRTAAILFGAYFAYRIWQRGLNAGGDTAHFAGLAFGVWWAKWGELWWRARGSRVLSSRGGARRAAGPSQGAGAWQDRVEQRRADAELIDRLLARVYEGGIHTLTPDERKALTEATDRQRREEEHHGRTDRL